MAFLEVSLMMVASWTRGELVTRGSLCICYVKSPAYLVMVATVDLHGICSWELSFIPLASLLIFTSLGQIHLLRYDLLGL